MSAAQKAIVAVLAVIHVCFVVRYYLAGRRVMRLAARFGPTSADTATGTRLARAADDPRSVTFVALGDGVLRAEMDGRTWVGKEAQVTSPFGLTYDPANPYVVSVGRLPLLGGIIAGGPVHEISRDLFREVVTDGHAGIGLVRMDAASNGQEVWIAIDQPAETVNPDDPLNLYNRTCLILPLDAVAAAVTRFDAIVACDDEEMDIDLSAEALARAGMTSPEDAS